jgi:hypothetical protein
MFAKNFLVLKRTPPIQAVSFDHPIERVSLSCDWSPTVHNNRQFVKLLSSRMNASAVGGEPSFRRWLFFGDSTMYQLLHYSPLKRILVHHSIDQITKACPFSCKKRLASRCHLNQVFGLPYRPDRQWYPPNYMLPTRPPMVSSQLYVRRGTRELRP